MPTDVIVRDATAADIPRLVELNRVVQDLHVAAHPDVFRPSDDRSGIEGFFARLIDDPEQFVLVAESGGRAVGYLCAEVQRRAAHTFVRAITRVYVHQIAVEVDAQGRGVGRALMGRLEEVAREAGLTEIALDTWSFNRDAQRFFSAVGFSTYNVRMWKRDAPPGAKHSSLIGG